jgi:ectoine hydroxylase-related dioxygenase (phytanoyl-CoA dioxygenase family)
MRMPATDRAIIEHYREHGFAVARGVISDGAFDPVIADIDRAVDQYARSQYEQGRIAERFSGLPFTTRLARLHEQAALTLRSWDELVDRATIRELVRDPGLVDALSDILGPDITFGGDFHLRPKLPDSELTAFPWHQDSQYYDAPIAVGASHGSSTAEAHIVTAWIPLVDVDEENGCLWVIPGSHRWGLLQGHRGADLNMRTAEDLERRGTPAPVPMRRGDVLFFSNLTFHASQVNRSNAVRWSLDLRYYATIGESAAGAPGTAAPSAIERYAALRRVSSFPPIVARGHGAPAGRG